MTMLEKHRTEYKLIDQAIHELSRVMQRLDTLETEAEEHKQNEERQASRLKSLDDLFFQEKMKNDTLSMDLERATAQRDQLQAEIRDLRESTEKEMALRAAEEEKLREDLARVTAERKEAVERLRASFAQMQELMNSVQPLIGPSETEDKLETT